MSEKVVCPNCENRYKGVATHWAKSSTCDYPNITARQREIMDGLLLSGAGGFIRERPRSEPKFVLHSTDKDLLNWLSNQFGVCGKPVREAATAEETKEQLASLREASGKGGEDFDYNTETLYRWETRTNSNFKRIWADWKGQDGAIRIPSSFDPMPLTFAVVYAIRGYLDKINSSLPGQVVAFYRAGNAVGSEDQWKQLFASFNPVTWGAKGRLILRGSEEFVRYIVSVDDSPLSELTDQFNNESLQLRTDSE